jgi:hypothetical protein
MEKKLFAVGKVVNGRITVMTAEGKGYSRPVAAPVRIEHVSTPLKFEIPEIEEVAVVPVEDQVDVMPWLKEYFEKKRVDYIPPQKKSLLSRLVQYIKEEFI